MAENPVKQRQIRIELMKKKLRTMCENGFKRSQMIAVLSLDHNVTPRKVAEDLRLFAQAGYIEDDGETIEWLAK